MILGRNSPLATFRVREPLIGENESGHGSPGGLDQKAQSLVLVNQAYPLYSGDKATHFQNHSVIEQRISASVIRIISFIKDDYSAHGEHLKRW
ncbi:hypothetical protein L1987_39896 [Smallanthus sonchifolius]|uniref:Uncharacterized protein n=1 Tax=Smallanthus sonchifolius TaxID=185202 RepID=A0ACB9GSW4_9ASTR|nr:hypothetical protein L1987_39896 [Smallanthus sonchifolius]